MSARLPWRGPGRSHGDSAFALDEDLGVPARAPAEAVEAQARRIADIRAKYRAMVKKFSGDGTILAAFRRGETIQGIAEMSHRSVADIEQVIRVELRRRARP